MDDPFKIALDRLQEVTQEFGYFSYEKVIYLLHVIDKADLPMPKIFPLMTELAGGYDIWGIQFEYEEEREEKEHYLEFEYSDKIKRFRMIGRGDTKSELPDGEDGVEVSIEEMLESIREFHDRK